MACATFQNGTPCETLAGRPISFGPVAHLLVPSKPFVHATLGAIDRVVRRAANRFTESTKDPACTHTTESLKVGGYVVHDDRTDREDDDNSPCQERARHGFFDPDGTGSPRRLLQHDVATGINDEDATHACAGTTGEFFDWNTWFNTFGDRGTFCDEPDPLACDLGLTNTFHDELASLEPCDQHGRHSCCNPDCHVEGKVLSRGIRCEGCYGMLHEASDDNGVQVVSGENAAWDQAAVSLRNAKVFADPGGGTLTGYRSSMGPRFYTVNTENVNKKMTLCSYPTQKFRGHCGDHGAADAARGVYTSPPMRDACLANAQYRVAAFVKKAYESTKASQGSIEVERKAYDAVKRVMSEYCLRGQPHPDSGAQPCPPAGDSAAKGNIHNCSRLNNDPLCTGWHQQDGKHDKYAIGGHKVSFASAHGVTITMDEDWWRVLGLGRGKLTAGENRLTDMPRAGETSVLDRGMRAYCRYVDDYEKDLGAGCRRVARGDMRTGNEPDPECACLRRYDTDAYRAWRSRKALAFSAPDATYNPPATAADTAALQAADQNAADGGAGGEEVGLVYGASGRCPLTVGRYIKDPTYPFKPKDDLCHYPACSPQSSNNLVPFGDRPQAGECTSDEDICSASILSGKAVTQIFSNVHCSASDGGTAVSKSGGAAVSTSGGTVVAAGGDDASMGDVRGPEGVGLGTVVAVVAVAGAVALLAVVYAVVMATRRRR